MAMSSVAETAVIQMQDYMELGAKDRMNIPSTPGGNWKWRMMPAQTTDGLTARILAMTKLYGRLPPAPVKV
jgi:4-alpha-glucanotransferase